MSLETTTQDDRLFELVQELSKDVKSLPSRHEFDALVDSQRRGFDSLELKFDKYVLATEFGTYKELVTSQIVPLVTHVEFEARRQFVDGAGASVCERIKKLEDTDDLIRSSRIQFPGAQYIVPGVVSALVAILSHFIK